MRRAVFISVALVLAVMISATSDAANIAKLKQEIEKITRTYPGDIGVATKHIETNEVVGVNASELYPMASTYKVGIMVEVFKQIEAGKFSIKDRIEFLEKNRAAGSGLLTHFDAGLNPTIHDLVLLMMSVSDNAATDLLLDRVGAANVTKTLREAGLTRIRVDRPTRQIIGDYNAIRQAFRPDQSLEAAAKFESSGKDVTTPADMTELLAKIYKGEIVSKGSCEQMIAILRNNQIRTRLQRHLPDGAQLYSKYGSIGLSLNDVGIMYLGDQHIAISVYLKNNRADRYLAEDVIGRIARAVYDYYNYAK